MNLDLSAVANKVRISQITFLGKCYNCGKTVDLSGILSVTNKQLLVKRFGITKQTNGRYVCKYVLEIDACRTCAVANAGC